MGADFANIFEERQFISYYKKKCTLALDRPTHWWNEMFFCPGSNSFFEIQWFSQPNAPQDTTIFKLSRDRLN